MSTLSDLINEIRIEISDDDSTRFTDAKIFKVLIKGIRRANRIAQRNGLQFAKKNVPLTCVSGQNYLGLSSSVSDFDVLIGMWRSDTKEQVPFRTEQYWEEIVSAASLENALLDYSNDKIWFNGVPSGATILDLWYYPTIGTASMTYSSTSPWDGRIDDIIMEYSANRLKNIDEMDLTFDTQLMTDMENQILQAYDLNNITMADTAGWTGNV